MPVLTFLKPRQQAAAVQATIEPNPSQEAPLASGPSAREIQLEQEWRDLADFFGEGSLDLTRHPATAVQDPVVRLAFQRLAGFLDQVRGLRIQQEELTFGAAAGAASNGRQMKIVAAHMNEARDQVEQASFSIGQCQTGVQEVARAASAAAISAHQVTDATSAGARVIHGAIDSLGQIQQEIGVAQSQIEILAQRSEEISRVSGVIDSVAKRTNLLALNAAIEAARAGHHGRGFSVVADEVRKLAEHTASQTQEIRNLLTEITGTLKQTQEAIRGGKALADEGAGLASEASRSLEQIQALVHEATQPLEQIAAVAEEQSAALEQVAASQQMISEQVASVTHQAEAVAAMTGELSGMTELAFNSLSQFTCGSHVDQVLTGLRETGRAITEVLESAVDRGLVTLDQMLALDYFEYKGQHVNRLQRLWGDLSRVPRDGFRPAKYGTAYDHLIDVEIREILDGMLKEQSGIHFVNLCDLNGYNPAQNSAFAGPVHTGDAESAFNSRVKRLRPDEAQVRAARMGLSWTEREPLALPGSPDDRNPKTVHRRQEFLQAGCNLKEPAGGDQGVLLQTTPRDTNVFNLLSVPIYVKGQRFGAVMTGWVPAAK